MLDLPDGFKPQYANRGVCGVVATAIAAEVSYDTARFALKQAMHKLYPYRQRMGGRTSYAQRTMALRMLATKFSEHPDYVGMTVKQFVELYAVAGAVYHLHFNRHVVTLRDGIIIDQYKNVHYTDTKVAGKVLNKPVIAILGKGW